MSLVVVCACGKRLRAKDGLAGKRVRCPACKQSLAVPLPLATVNPSLSPPGEVAALAMRSGPAEARAADQRPPAWRAAPVVAALGAALIVLPAVFCGGAAFTLLLRPKSAPPASEAPKLPPGTKQVEGGTSKPRDEDDGDAGGFKNARIPRDGNVVFDPPPGSWQKPPVIPPRPQPADAWPPGGTGRFPGPSPFPDQGAACPFCNGSGTTPFLCTFCNGTGVSNGFKCSICQGKRFSECTACGGTGRARTP